MRVSIVSTAIATAVVLASVPAFAGPPADEPPAQTPSGTDAAPPADGSQEELKPSPEQQAMELFRQGEEAYGLADYDKALEHFQDAQSLYPSAVFHYNIGQCYEALEKLEQAVTAYRAYLRSNPNDAANVERKVETLEDLLASESKPEPAPEPGPTPEPQPEDKDRKKEFPAGVLIGLGAAGIVLGGVGLGVGAGVFGTRAGNLSDELDAVNNGNPDRLTREEAQDLETRGQSAQTLQIVFMSVGGALAVLGTAELISGIILHRKQKKAAESRPSVTAAPVFTTSGAGLSLTGRF